MRHCLTTAFLILLTVLFLLFFVGSVGAADVVCTWNAGVTTSATDDGKGTPGNNVQAHLIRNNDGITYTLHLSGNGDMYNFAWNPIRDGKDFVQLWHEPEYVSNITTIEFEEGSSITSIGNSAFHGLRNVKSVTIPSTVTKIGVGAFASGGLTDNLVIPDSVTIIGNFAFQDNLNLVSISFNVINLGTENIFDMNPNLEKLCFGKDVQNFDGWVVYACPKLSHIIVDNENPYLKCDDNVIFNKDGTKLVFSAIAKTGVYTIPDGVTEIQRQAFRESKLTQIIIPEGITKINPSTFNGASELTQLVLPASLISFSANSISDCTSLHTIDFTKLQAQINDNGNFVTTGNNYPMRIVYVSAVFEHSEESILSKFTPTINDAQIQPKAVVAQTNGGTFLKGTIFKEGVLAEPYRENYVFEGWYTNSELTNKVTTPTTTESLIQSYDDDETKIYYAKWIEATHSVSFNNNTGEGEMAKQYFKSGKSIPLVKNTFTKQGYTFAGWNTTSPEGTTVDYCDGALVTFENTDTESPKEYTYYAVWMPNTDTTYTVEHYQQNLEDSGYTKIETESKTGTTDTSVSTDVIKSYDGFTYDKRDGLPTINGDGSSVVKLYYTRNSYYVTFISDDEPVLSEEVKYGSLIPAPDAPVKNDEELVGWFKDSGYADEWNFDTDTVIEKTTLYAKWTKKVSGGVPASPSSSSASTGKYLTYPRTVENGGTVEFGTSPVVTSVILPDGTLGRVVLTLASTDEWPAQEQTSYGFDLSVDKMGDGTASICFSISAVELQRLGVEPQDIALFHFEDGKWNHLQTEYEVLPSVIEYIALVESFSPFEIRFIENGAVEKKSEESMPPDNPDTEPTPVEPLPPIEDSPTARPTESPIPLLGMILGIISVGMVFRRRR